MKKSIACTALLLSLSLAKAQAQEEELATPPSTNEDAPPPPAPEEPMSELPSEDSSRIIENIETEEAPPQKPVSSSFRIGPTVQIGFPHPITYGLEAIYGGIVSFGISAGSFKLDIDPAELTISSYEAHARWHPWAGSFFLGGAFGKQSLKGKAEDEISYSQGPTTITAPATIDVDINSSFFTPHLGWFAVWDSGLTMGFEIGVQIPLSPKSEVALDSAGLTPAEEAALKATEDYKDLKKQADDAAQLLGEKSVPYITLFRIGYVF